MDTHTHTQLSPLGAVFLTEIPSSFKRHKSSLSLIITRRALSWCHRNYLQNSLFIKLTSTPTTANIQRAPACNLTMFARQGPLTDSPCKRPAGSCPPSSRLPDMMLLGSLNMKPGTANRFLSRQSMQNWFRFMDLNSLSCADPGIRLKVWQHSHSAPNAPS